MNNDERLLIGGVVDDLKHIAGESDVDDACLRVARRKLAELLGLPLDGYRLLREQLPVKPLYYKPPVNQS